MAYRVIFQERAERDIASAFLYIAEDNGDAAVKWYRGLKTEIAALTDMPARYPMAPEARKLGIEIHQLLFGKRTGTYRVIFVIDESKNEINILTVRHGARKPLKIEDIE